MWKRGWKNWREKKTTILTGTTNSTLPLLDWGTSDEIKTIWIYETLWVSNQRRFEASLCEKKRICKQCDAEVCYIGLLSSVWETDMFPLTGLSPNLPSPISNSIPKRQASSLWKLCRHFISKSWKYLPPSPTAFPKTAPECRPAPTFILKSVFLCFYDNGSSYPPYL